MANNFRRITKYALWSATILSVTTAPVLAQPTSVNPRLIEKQRIETPMAPKASQAPVATPAQDVQAPADADAVHFTLKEVSVQGSTVYSNEELAAASAKFIGQKVALSDIYSIARAITAKYRNDGYVLSRAIVPPQKVKNGVVNIQVVEGYVSDVRVEGAANDTRGLLQSYAEKVKQQRPLNTKTLERYLLLSDDLPGVTARGVLQPAPAGAGASVLTVTVTEDKTEGALSVDNRGSRFLGRYEVTALAAANNLFGIYDRTTVRGLVSGELEELRFFDITHEDQLGREGTVLETRLAYTETNPGGFIDSLDIEGESATINLIARHPFLRTRTENLFGRVGFEANNTNSSTLGFETFEDHVRSVSAGLTYDFVDGMSGINLLDFSMTQGLNILDQTEQSDPGFRSRANGHSDFTRFNAEASHLHDLGNDFSAFLSVAGQYSLDALFSSEEFAVGGSEYGRAFDAAELTGDHGAAAKIELRYRGYPNEEYAKSYQTYVFYDIGKVWNKDTIVGEEGSQTLASAGLGIRTNFSEDLSGYAEIAFPLLRDIVSESKDGDEPRLFVSLTKRF